MAVFTQDGRVVLAQALYDLTFYLAVGEGLPEWDSIFPPTTPEEQALRDAEWTVLTDLENKVGLTRTRDKLYVTPDPAGEIIMADGAKYSKSVDPTPYIFCRFQLDLSDASENTLRETGIFVGVQINDAVPAGQMFIPVADILTPGKMVEVDRFAPIVRDGSIGQTFTYVLTM